jgi:hypothetical protein
MKVDHSMRVDQLLADVLSRPVVRHPSRLTEREDSEAIKKHKFEDAELRLDCAALLFIRVGLSRGGRGSTLLVPSSAFGYAPVCEAIGFKIKDSNNFEISFLGSKGKIG